MNHFHTSPRWSTSSAGSTADTSPMELAALGEHLRRCNEQRGGLSAFRCVGEALKEFAAPRLITTLALCAVLAVVGALLI